MTKKKARRRNTPLKRFIRHWIAETLGLSLTHTSRLFSPGFDPESVNEYLRSLGYPRKARIQRTKPGRKPPPVKKEQPKPPEPEEERVEEDDDKGFYLPHKPEDDLW